jgi:two-component system nitrate/nitrite response regulator NarL
MDPPAGGYVPVRLPSARRIDVLVVDGQPVVQQGVRLFLESAEGIRGVHEAVSGREAIDAARRLSPDVVLVDPWLGDMLLEEAVRRIGAASPRSRLVIFAAQLSPSLLEETARLGVHGVLSKEAGPSRLLEVVISVAGGQVVEEVGNDQMLRRAADKVNGVPLTPREHEVLRRAARGESNAEIAGAIYLAPTTVKSYLQSALRKLGARNRVEAVVKLSELRIL